MTTESRGSCAGSRATSDEHVEALVARRDVDAAMRTMTAEPSVRQIPTMTGPSADGVERFYHDALLPHLPGDLADPARRIVDRFRLVDELTVSFLHDCELAWLLPGSRPPASRLRRGDT